MKFLVGIQPTAASLHIGNYLGCIKPALELQKDPNNKVTFLIAHMHSLLSGMDFHELHKNVQSLTHQLKKLGATEVITQPPDTLAVFLKLLSISSLASLKKLPQYKDKSEKTIYDMGLLTYPVLMAADIFIANPDAILIGPDQKAHIDFANDLVKRAVPTGFKPYNGILSINGKIGCLVNPAAKMSKSGDPRGVLWMFQDSEEDYLTTLRRAITDAPGRANLENIYHGLTSEDSTPPKSNLELKTEIARELHKLCG